MYLLVKPTLPSYKPTSSLSTLAKNKSELVERYLSIHPSIHPSLPACTIKNKILKKFLKNPGWYPKIDIPKTTTHSLNKVPNPGVNKRSWTPGIKDRSRIQVSDLEFRNQEQVLNPDIEDRSWIHMWKLNSTSTNCRWGDDEIRKRQISECPLLGENRAVAKKRQPRGSRTVQRQPRVSLPLSLSLVLQSSAPAACV